MEPNKYFSFYYNLSMVDIQTNLLNNDHKRIGPEFPHDRDLLREGNFEGLTFPKIYKIQSGKRFGLFIGTLWFNCYLVSSEFVEMLIKAKITGWTTYPIILLDKKDKLIEGYHGFAVCGKAGTFHCYEDNFVYKENEHTEKLAKYYVGTWFDESTYDGSDMFMLDDSGYIILNQKSKEFFLNLKLRKVQIEDISTIYTDELLWSYLPSHKIRKLFV